MTPEDRELYRRYAKDEQDNPNPTEEDIDESIKASIRVYGSEQMAVFTMRQQYGLPTGAEELMDKAQQTYEQSLADQADDEDYQDDYYPC